MRKITVFTLLLLLLLGTVTVSAEEPDAKVESILANATEYHGNYYLLFEGNYTWEQAKTCCEGLGGHLATVTTAEEDDFCFALWKASAYQGCWLGASDSATDGVWQWVTNEVWNYVNWGDAEPNGGTRENTLSYYDAYTTGRWNDNASNVTFPFLCEWEADAIESVRKNYGFVNSSDSRYRNAFYFNGNIYNIFNYEMDWTAAKAHCEQIGGHLATIASAQENQALFAYVTMLDPSYNCVFGATDQDQEGLWKWPNGEPLTYENWGKGEPNNTGGAEHYAHFLNTYDGTWNDTKWQNSFLCEWDHCCVTADGVLTTHLFSQEEILQPVSCTSSGEVKHICGNCGYTTQEILAQLPHAYGDEVVQKATCTAAGEAKRVCRDCGHVSARVLEQLPHEYGDYVIVSGNKLIPPIVKEKTCAICHEVQTQNDWSNVWITVLAGVAVIALIVGVISYAKAFRKRP